METHALVKEFQHAETLNVVENTDMVDVNFLVKLQTLGQFQTFAAEDLCFKCILLLLFPDVYLASVVKEGFEHNWREVFVTMNINFLKQRTFLN